MTDQDPIIGFTGPDRGGLPMWLFARWCIQRAGGQPMRITPSHPPEHELDGLILGGGTDLDTELYGQSLAEAKEQLKGNNRLRALGAQLVGVGLTVIRWALRKASGPSPYPDKARDQMEWGLLAEAEKRRLPVLGICRGMQLLNIFRGGDLHQDLSSFYVETPATRSVFPCKTVNLTKGSSLRGLMKTEQIEVNALHDQGVNQLGERLKACARDDNGIIQAIEAVDAPFLMAVQWHPEFMPQVARQQRTFRALVAAAAEAAESGDRERAA